MRGRIRSGSTKLLVALMLGLLGAGCGPPSPDEVTGVPGRPLEGLTEEELGRFLLGKAVFERLVVPEEGLGPLFNETRCSACHIDPAVGGTGGPRVLKATRWENGECDLLEAEGGTIIQQQVTPALQDALGVTGQEIPEHATHISNVASTPLFGLGLVEAIPEEDIAGRAAGAGASPDGVSGRLGRTTDGRTGRFGRKADFASIHDFVDSALLTELGLTTPDRPRELGVGGEPLPPSIDPTPNPEMDQRGIQLLVDYIRLLALPARERSEHEAVRDSILRGEVVFEEVGCASCHTPSLQTGRSEVAALDRKVVPLYSDLLLHDLGPELASVCAPGVAPTEHRTAILAGLRHRGELMYDGRARSPEQAVLLHGGEASGVREAFQALDPESRALLLRFLGSL